MLEVEHVISDLTSMCKATDITKLELKLPDILQNVQAMKKRLKATTTVEQKEFNSRRYEQDNPYYISKNSTTSMASKYDDDGQPQVEFKLNRDKILLVSYL